MEDMFFTLAISNIGSFSVGDNVLAQYDELRRQSIRTNHTGTHVLNFALREVLGEKVEQKGSLVAPEKLRFDFSHRVGITDEELKLVEDISTKQIADDKQVYSSEVNLSTARHIEGVRAVFGETYPDPVRVVSIGIAIDSLTADASSKDWRKYSVEFCGGTHVERTGEIKKLIVLEESGIAKGVRRIIAVTGKEAIQAERVAGTFEEDRLERLERMAFSPEKEKLVKEIQAELPKLPISTLTKKTFAKRVEKAVKDMIKEQKEVKKAQLEIIVKLVTAYFEQDEARTSFVAKIPSNSSAKAVSEAIKYVSSKYKDKSIYFIGLDSSTAKIAHGCSVSTVSQVLMILKRPNTNPSGRNTRRWDLLLGSGPHRYQKW
jgi:alanyl-tRNA synthetase